MKERGGKKDRQRESLVLKIREGKIRGGEGHSRERITGGQRHFAQA